MDTATFTNRLNSSQPLILKKFLETLDTEEHQEFRLSSILYSQPLQEFDKKQVWNWRQSSHLECFAR